MQAKKLKNLLNNPGYNIHFRDGKVCVGSSLCSDLITVDAKSYQIKYALDTFREGRKSIRSEALEFIWDKLLELIESGELKNIIENDDPIEGMFPVYSHHEGKIIKRYVDDYGWPNVAHDGTLIYDNTFFCTESEAIEYGIKDLGYCIKSCNEHIAEQEEKIQQIKTLRDECAVWITKLNEEHKKYIG